MNETSVNDASMKSRRILDGCLITVAISGFILAGAALMFGRVSWSLAGLRISSSTMFRPAAIAFAALLLVTRASVTRERQLTALLKRAADRSSTIAACLASVTFLLAIHFGTFEAGSADQYGYVSQAELWTRGAVTQFEPMAAQAPWPNATWTVAPLGYRPGPVPDTTVPTYAVGLPLMMALLIRVTGPFGAYLAVPLLGALAVWATFVLGRRFGGPACGLAAAMLLMSSPVFLFHLAEPMSDVPAAAWLVVATVLALNRTRLSSLAAGLALSALILTRPNLLPTAIPLAAFLTLGAGAREGAWRFVLFLLGTVPGCIVTLRLNLLLYGDPVVSGYGSSAAMFALHNGWPNLVRYPRWLVETETPFVCLALLAPVVIGAEKEQEVATSMRSTMWLCLEISVVVFLSYLFYLPFESWTYLRFLLPMLPLMLTLTSAVGLRIGARLAGSRRDAWLAVAFGLLIAWRFDTAMSHGVRPTSERDRRYASVGAFIARELPSNAIILTVMHSGSARYYSGRMTLRWDWIAPEWLDPALDFLRTSGYRPYLLVEDWERSHFQSRFAGYSSLAALDWQPVAVYGSVSRSMLYDPEGRTLDASAVSASPKLMTPQTGSIFRLLAGGSVFGR